jgi:hypothetical protein
MIMSGNVAESASSVKPLTSIDKMKTECLNNVDELGRRAQDNEGAASADKIQATRMRIESMKNRCERVASLQKATDPYAGVAETVEIADGFMAVAEDKYKTFSASDCKEGQKTDICDGRMGLFEGLKDYYTKRADLYDRKCPGGQPLAVSTRRTERVQLAKETVVQASTAVLPTMPPPEQPSLMQRFFNWIRGKSNATFAQQQSPG